ncbi:MAG TPA: cbb3-type cytochrome c oxidase subunit I [Thermoprotei archaeon]|nr:cbb3-type cytochrome c oxidase subunit I [Thermoprotei archaeon]
MGLGYREKLALRYVLAGVFWLGVAGIEGILMRARLLGYISDFYHPEEYYAVMTVHPYVGIYGWAYMAVMGAFYYLVPLVLKKNLYSERVANISFWTMFFGVLITWLSGFVFKFSALYTLYWPLPVMEYPANSTLVFSIGTIMIFASVLAFFFNMFATIFLPARGAGGAGYVAKELLTLAFNLDKLKAKTKGIKEYLPRVYTYPVFVVGVFRGCVDTTLNAIVMAGISVILGVYSIANLIGSAIPATVIDPLIYKNVYWWGLDLIADGNVLIFTAAVWYFLVPQLVGRDLFGESLVRTVILADLVISLFVWNHHMLADTPQPFILQIQGQIFTWGELITMGLTMFAVLMTIWYARPVKYSPALLAIVLSILGYAIGGSAGILQANYALNRYFHNTQWIIGIHGHIQLLAGLSLTIFAAIYAAAPLITGKEMDRKLAYISIVAFFVGAVVMGLAMGLAGVSGMLRRTLYFNGEYFGYMAVAMVGALTMAFGYLTFIYNFVKTYGFKTVINIFK